jgi:hypothetical protein
VKNKTVIVIQYVGTTGTNSRGREGIGVSDKSGLTSEAGIFQADPVGFSQLRGHRKSHPVRPAAVGAKIAFPSPNIRRFIFPSLIPKKIGATIAISGNSLRLKKMYSLRPNIIPDITLF